MKVGDKVKITGRTAYAHNLVIGSIATVKDIGSITSNTVRLEGEVKGLNGPQSQWLHPKDFELVTKTQVVLKTKQAKMKATATDILNAATKLAQANNTVTTLEIKTELRKTFDVKQHQVSMAMIDAAKTGMFIYTDNGTYRVYSLANKVSTPGKRGLTKGSATALAAGAKAAATRAANKGGAVPTGTISRTEARKRILGYGKIQKVTFIKKDGTERTLTGVIVKDQSDLGLGYIKMKDLVKSKREGKDVIRNVNIQTLTSFQQNKVLNRVK